MSGRGGRGGRGGGSRGGRGGGIGGGGGGGGGGGAFAFDELEPDYSVTELFPVNLTSNKPLFNYPVLKFAKQ